ncbi:AzlC family ABC transporter permease [Cellulosimicrobium composti]|uniref:AzlC family ABC transporter permease n=1 Tax=Cellulosimicrobium composti TaxID=2672572 RepID=A0ABX0BDY8_9MICO|nr:MULTISPECIES: AzlC family ABC transporter permease [Cellulosimicrobium]NDO89241.1 AzlC family ABC transporter permease [Cellulosimicrobium composti]TWG82386.1 putative branched-subunit amino acid permease [Cellulosimicrobium cellulans J34]SMF32821.1 Predicted branched-chain amino acid permease (azaleucine resistance) [Cellulosimicrobium cellulans J1]
MTRPDDVPRPGADAAPDRDRALDAEVDDVVETAVEDEVRAAVRQAVSVSVATGLYGVSFGALSVVAGLDVAQTMALSLLMFSGGSQFALIGVVGAGGAAGAAVATAGFLGVRNALYGAQLGPLLALRSWHKVLAAQFTIDESTAVATAQRSRRAVRAGFWWTGVGIFVLWNAMTLVGALAGDALGDPRAWGLDAAAAAAFLGLLWPRLAARAMQLTAAAAVVVAAVLVPLAPGGVPVLAAAGVAIVVGQVDARRRRPAPGPRPGADPGEERS